VLIDLSAWDYLTPTAIASTPFEQRGGGNLAAGDRTHPFCDLVIRENAITVPELAHVALADLQALRDRLFLYPVSGAPCREGTEQANRKPLHNVCCSNRSLLVSTKFASGS
jgi:hypothetical protein